MVLIVPEKAQKIENTLKHSEFCEKLWSPSPNQLNGTLFHFISKALFHSKLVPPFKPLNRQSSALVQDLPAHPVMSFHYFTISATSRGGGQCSFTY